MDEKKPLTEEQKEKHRAASRKYAQEHAEWNRARVKQWAIDNPEKVKAYNEARKEKQLENNRRWRKENPEKHKAQQHRRYLRHRNGRPLPGGLCDLCGQEETALARRDTGEKRALQQDHDHKTGVLRGRICLDCNRGLGAFKDDPELLRAAATYIEKYRPPLGVCNGDTPLRDIGEL